MAMKITFEIDDTAMIDTVLAMLVGDATHAVNPDTPQVERQQPDPAPEPAAPRPGTAAALLGASGEPAIMDQTPATNTGAGPTMVDMLTQQAQSAGRHQTDYLQTVDKKRLKHGDEVLTADGAVGTIHATFRGQAILEFDDGSAAMHKSNTLHSVPQTDVEPPANTGTERTGVTSVNGSKIDAASAQILRQVAENVCNNRLAKPEEIILILGEFKVTNFSDLPVAAFEPVEAALNALAAAPSAATGSHGF